jgi:hypothetical protein
MCSALTMMFSPFNLVTSIMAGAFRFLFYFTDSREFNNHARHALRKDFRLRASDQASSPGRARSPGVGERAPRSGADAA